MKRQLLLLFSQTSCKTLIFMFFTRTCKKSSSISAIRCIIIYEWKYEIFTSKNQLITGEFKKFQKFFLNLKIFWKTATWILSPQFYFSSEHAKSGTLVQKQLIFPFCFRQKILEGFKVLSDYIHNHSNNLKKHISTKIHN